MKLKQFLEREPTQTELNLYEKYKDVKGIILSKDIFGNLSVEKYGKFCF